MNEKTTSNLDVDGNNLSYANFRDLSETRYIETEFTVIPRSSKPDNDASAQVWRILLIPVGISGPALAYELHSEAVVGVAQDSGDRDAYVDLADWGAYDAGVSRRHIMLRPNPKNLYAIDLRSTNGTHINGLPLGVGWAYSIQDGDLVTLGQLHFRIRIVAKPQ